MARNKLPRRASGLGPAIRRARRTSGLTQDQLAEAVGVHRPSVSAWERGVHAPSEGNLRDVARALSMTVEALRELSDGEEGGASPGRVRESTGGYAARPMPRVPPRAYQLIFEYCEALEQAEVPEELVDEARRLMSGETFNTMRKHTAQERSEEGWIKDVKAAWAFISDTLREKGFDL